MTKSDQARCKYKVEMYELVENLNIDKPIDVILMLGTATKQALII